MTYPRVLNEAATLHRVLAGESLARYGDGEFKLCRGGSAVAQRYDPRISARLREILIDSGACLVGIPNIYSETPKDTFWKTFLWTTAYLTDRSYVSSFITRPDSAPWIDEPSYWHRLESLWLGRDVTLVHGSHKSLKPDDLLGAGEIREIFCPTQHAFAEYDSILARVMERPPARALICLGPTATVLAVDLCARGVHAIDLGHVALFLRKHRQGLPMWLSKDDKSADKVPV